VPDVPTYLPTYRIVHRVIKWKVLSRGEAIFHAFHVSGGSNRRAWPHTHSARSTSDGVLVICLQWRGASRRAFISGSSVSGSSRVTSASPRCYDIALLWGALLPDASKAVTRIVAQRYSRSKISDPKNSFRNVHSKFLAEISLQESENTITLHFLKKSDNF